MRLYCGNTDCIYHELGIAGCELDDVRLDAQGGCLNAGYLAGYWEEQENKLRRRIEK